MLITVFAKTVTTKNGNQFERYITKMEDKDGVTHTMSVKFRKSCGVPETFPHNIYIGKDDCNISKKTYTKNNTGETYVAEELWISDWIEGPMYVDHSTDNFNFD